MNPKDLQDVVVTLEYHDEEHHANQLRKYIASKRGWKNRLFAVLKKFVFWFILLGTTTAIVYGFIKSMLEGSFFAGLGILLFGTIIYGLLTLIYEGSEAIYDWYQEDMPAGRVQ